MICVEPLTISNNLTYCVFRLKLKHILYLNYKFRIIFMFWKKKLNVIFKKVQITLQLKLNRMFVLEMLTQKST